MVQGQPPYVATGHRLLATALPCTMSLRRCACCWLCTTPLLSHAHHQSWLTGWARPDHTLLQRGTTTTTHRSFSPSLPPPGRDHRHAKVNAQSVGLQVSSRAFAAVTLIPGRKRAQAATRAHPRVHTPTAHSLTRLVPHLPAFLPPVRCPLATPKAWRCPPPSGAWCHAMPCSSTAGRRRGRRGWPCVPAPRASSRQGRVAGAAGGGRGTATVLMGCYLSA